MELYLLCMCVYNLGFLFFLCLLFVAKKRGPEHKTLEVCVFDAKLCVRKQLSIELYLLCVLGLFFSFSAFSS
jgi:hypothetical protein